MLNRGTSNLKLPLQGEKCRLVQLVRWDDWKARATTDRPSAKNAIAKADDLVPATTGRLIISLRGGRRLSLEAGLLDDRSFVTLQHRDDR
jgi:hypothetical protein